MRQEIRSSQHARIRENFIFMSVNYVVACWAGARRSGGKAYDQDRGIFLRTQLEFLHRFKHSLDQVTIVVAKNPTPEPEFDSIVDEIRNDIVKYPFQIALLERPNVGMSYGSWSYAYGAYRDKFDHYIFVEDDYVFVVDWFDRILVDILTLKNCGYLCGYVMPARPGHGDYSPETAAISNGIASSVVLEEIWKRNDSLPHSPRLDYSSNEVLGQIGLSQAFAAVGKTLCDTTDNFSCPFWEAGQYLTVYGDPMNPPLMMPVQALPNRKLLRLA